MRKCYKVFAGLFLLACFFSISILNVDILASDVYTITYNLDGGKNDSRNPSEYDGQTQVTLYDASKEGYEFVGWFDSSNTEVSEILVGTNTNYELTANWQISEYTITYVLNGGVNDSSNPNGYTVNSSDIELKNPTRVGYTFSGWSLDGNVVTNISSGSTGDIVLEAVWGDVFYNITYNLDGGTNSASNPSRFNIDSNITLADPTKDNFKFLGWFIDSNFQTRIKNINNQTGDISLYAKWGSKSVISSDSLATINTDDFFLDGTNLQVENLTEEYLKGLDFKSIYSNYDIHSGYSLNLMIESQKIILDGSVQVRIMINSDVLLNDETFTLIAVDSNGNYNKVNFTKDDNCVVFDTNYLENYVIITSAPVEKTYPVLTMVGYIVSLVLLVMFVGLSISYYILNKKLNTKVLNSTVLPLAILMSYIERSAIVLMVLLSFGVIVMAFMNIKTILELKRKK